MRSGNEEVRGEGDIKGGFAGKILFVDLSERAFREESLAEAEVRRYLGGAG